MLPRIPTEEVKDQEEGRTVPKMSGNPPPGIKLTADQRKQFGKTPGCKGCNQTAGGGQRHNRECRQRKKSMFGEGAAEEDDERPIETPTERDPVLKGVRLSGKKSEEQHKHDIGGQNEEVKEDVEITEEMQDVIDAEPKVSLEEIIPGVKRRQEESRSSSSTGEPDKRARLVAAIEKFGEETGNEEDKVEVSFEEFEDDWVELGEKDNGDYSEAVSNELEGLDKLKVVKVVKIEDWMKLIGTEWVKKKKANGTLRARLVAKEFAIDKPTADMWAATPAQAAFKTFLAMTSGEMQKNSWKSADEQVISVIIDVIKAFMHADLDEPVSVRPPPEAGCGKDECWEVSKAMNGLRKAPAAWKKHFTAVLEN